MFVSLCCSTHMLDNFDIARNASPNYTLPPFNHLFFHFMLFGPVVVNLIFVPCVNFAVIITYIGNAENSYRQLQ